MEEIYDIILGGQRLDLLGLDVCLGSGIEIMKKVSPYVDVFVASENVEPAGGWPEEPILNDFKQYSTASATWHAQNNIVPNYDAYIGREDKTMSAYFGSTVQSSFLVELEEFAGALVVEEGIYHTEINNALSASEKMFLYEIVDIVSFCNQLRSRLPTTSDIYIEAGNVITAHNNARIAEIHGSTGPNANGVSIYIPDSIFMVITTGDQGFDFYRASGGYWSTTWNSFIQELYAGGDATPPTVTVNQATYGWYASDPGNVIDVDFDSGTTIPDYSNSILDYAQYKVGATGVWRNIFTSNGLTCKRERTQCIFAVLTLEGMLLRQQSR